MTHKRHATTETFKCACGETFNTLPEYREHMNSHGRWKHATAAAAGAGTQKSTAIGQQQGETAPGDNQKGREESQQGWRQPSRHGGPDGSDGRPGNQQEWREAKNRPDGGPDGGMDQVPQVGDEHEWKHGKQEDNTKDELMDDWGKSDKH